MARLLLIITTALVMAMLFICSSWLHAFRPALVAEMQSLEIENDLALPVIKHRMLLQKSMKVGFNRVAHEEEGDQITGFNRSTSQGKPSLLESELRQAPSGPDPLHHNGSPVKISP